MNDGAWMRDLRKVADLIEFDGPLLALLIDNEGDMWMAHWCDVNATHNTWMYYRVSNFCLYELLACKMSLLDALKVAYRVHLVEVDGDGNPSSCRAMPTKDLPEHYLPEPGAMLTRMEDPR